MEAFGYDHFASTPTTFDRYIEELIQEGKLQIDKPIEYFDFDRIKLNLYDKVWPSFREVAKQAQGEFYA
ncbi:MAG: hypothetical protein ABEK59_11995 [Halobacteria archaeon]